MQLPEMEIASPQVHDLLRLDPDLRHLGCIGAPSWARQTLASCPCVVVRRAQAPAGQIAVGVRGPTRSERWGCFILKDMIRQLLKPCQLLAFAQSSALSPRTPPFTTLQQLIERWRGLTLPWGPTGSVGFELATGWPVTTSSSDLDVAIRTNVRISLEQARSLYESATGLETKVDIRVETPVCGFSLKEFAGRGPAAILLRVPRGIVLAKDPWGDEIGSMDPNYAAARSILVTRDCGRLRKNECRRTDVQMNRRKGAATRSTSPGRKRLPL
jgi:phosphoribosyl-dephospho-CoA transferase